MSKREFINHLNLPDKDRSALLNRVDHSAEQEESKVVAGKGNQRRDRRSPYRQANIPIELDHPGGSSSRVLGATRNISAGGMSVIHGGYVHVGSTCRFVLRRMDGTIVPMTGTVRSCRLIQAPAHEVGIQFDEKIDPAEFHLPESDEADRAA